MEGFSLVEFYVSCNPPLLASGVQHFIQELQNAPFQKEGTKVLEILYEPSGPWFKVITYEVFKSEVTDAIATLLAAITEENTRPLEQPEEYADVHTTSLAIPWSAFSTSSTYQTDFVPWQFPVTMQELAFKTIWPRKFLVFNLEDMLHMLSRLNGSQTEDPTVGSLDPLLSCTVSSNLRKTMLYIGTNSSRETLDNAHKILDSLFDLTTAAIKTQHVIYTTEPAEKFSYKWFSHLGLDVRTFPQLASHYQRLRRVVSIRTVTQASQRRRDTCPTRNEPKAPAASKMCLNNSFRRDKYPSKGAQKSSPNSEIMVSTNSTSSSPDCFGHNGESRPSPRDNDHQIKHHSEISIDGDELLIFDMDDVSERDSQVSSGPQHSQPSLVSLLDDDPPANLASSLLKPNPSEPEPEPRPEPASAEASSISSIHTRICRILFSLGQVLSKCLLVLKIKNHRSRPHVIKLLEKHLQSLWPILPRCPGFVTVHLQFGRFYLTDLSDADVDSGTGPHRKMKDLLRELEAVEGERIGFSTILSRLRSDARVLVEYPTSPWVCLGDDLIYQIQCTFDDKKMTIDVDATTFDFNCHGPTSELGCTLVHCVQRAWDLKLAVNHSSNFNTSPAHRIIGQAITNSLHVRSVPTAVIECCRRFSVIFVPETNCCSSTAPNGEHVFELMTSREGWTITAVRIRRTTRYQSNQTPDSLLCISEFQKLRPTEERYKRRRWTIPKDTSSKGPRPESWFEAYVSSATLDALLKENVNLALGRQLQWASSQQDDICDSLFGPALETVAQLDEVGKWNDNGLSGGKLSFKDSAEAREGSWQSEVIYW
ncbi:hypothetical protein E4U55_001697 [Claviceps digitariae]|nr:hypothetical protein E4U55_001697 [Claviceps digitariae]